MSALRKSAPEAVLEVSGLAFAYDGALAVRDVSLTVQPGEIVALLGANGAGKSTTVSMIAGVLRPQKGTIHFGGEQQMLAIARGLMAEPRLIILDEPSLGLMPIVTQEVFRLIEAVNKSGISVLLVEQNLHQSLRIAHRGYVLEKGAVALAGTGKELLADAYVQRAFLGR